MNLLEAVRRDLDALRRAHLVRQPRVVERVRGPYVTVEGREVLSFCSNDYLGIAQDPRVAEVVAAAVREHGWGAAASRALQGTSRLHRGLEERIAAVKGTADALLFPSGYAANVGLLQTIADKDTLIVADALNHASLIDGCRLSRARVEIYPHGDAEAAKRLSTSPAARTFILTDTVFSMDGDLAPLEALSAVGADLVVDDVHGLGVFGPDGRGCLDVPVQTGNLAKAAGGIGGFVAGPSELIELVRSKARTWLFTTAPPAAVCAAGLEGLRIMAAEPERRERLWSNVRALGAVSPIRTVIVGANDAALDASARLWEKGFFVPAIRPPTVPEGTARLRVTVTAMHAREHVEALVEALRKI